MQTKIKIRICKLCLFLLYSTQGFSDYREDVQYNRLAVEIAGFLPDGNGVTVTQVEAAIGASSTDVGAWLPNATSTQFNFKTIVDQSIPVSDGNSSHATGVASLFYGNSGSMAPGVSNIDAFSAIDWLNNFLNTNALSEPLSNASRVSNHSWIGGGQPVQEVSKKLLSDALRRVDWLVETDEAIQIVAMGNDTTNQPLLGSAYNVIAVGRTDGNHGQGSVALDADYNTAKVRPDIVAPLGVTSSATPVVAAATAMLIEQAHQAGVAANSSSTKNRNKDTIYNGERSEVVKAIIMTGADRITHNSSSAAQINDYRSSVSNQSDNGLDKRFGAGQLNVYNNYQIMLAGEQDSLQDGGPAMVVLLGYDYYAGFGGDEESNELASYRFSTAGLTGELSLAASLVWNIKVDDGPENGFDPQVTLYNLDLLLFDITRGVSNKTLLFGSASDNDNTENIWINVTENHDYELVVAIAENTSFDWDYGIAWQVTAVPVPSAIWLFISGITCVMVFGRSR